MQFEPTRKRHSMGWWLNVRECTTSQPRQVGFTDIRMLEVAPERVEGGAWREDMKRKVRKAEQKEEERALVAKEKEEVYRRTGEAATASERLKYAIKNDDAQAIAYQVCVTLLVVRRPLSRTLCLLSLTPVIPNSIDGAPPRLHYAM